MRIIYSEKHQLHDTAQVFVEEQLFVIEELPIRAELVREGLLAAGHGPVLPPHDFGIEPIRSVHSAGYLDFLQRAYQENAHYRGAKVPLFPETYGNRPLHNLPVHIIAQTGYYCFGTSTPILEQTWTAAYWSAQCALTGAALLQEGEQQVYTVCRPPGHHAGTDLYGGFCYLNNAAIAARFLGGKGAILDIDYHHGNGTQEIFYHDPGVLYCSLHADPAQDYPWFWGFSNERGAGPGEGYNRNWPLPLGTSEPTYLAALDEALELIGQFDPGWLIVSAGLDIAQGDPVGGFHISLEGMAEIGRRLALVNRPTLFIQEGGYKLDELGRYAQALVSSFTENN